MLVVSKNMMHRIYPLFTLKYFNLERYKRPWIYRFNGHIYNICQTFVPTQKDGVIYLFHFTPIPWSVNLCQQQKFQAF